MRPLVCCAKRKWTLVSAASSFLPPACTVLYRVYGAVLHLDGVSSYWIVAPAPRLETPRHDWKTMLEARKDMPPLYEAPFLCLDRHDVRVSFGSWECV